MKKNILLLLTMGIIITAMTGCRDTSTAGADPESVETTSKEQETSELTIFDQVIAGEAVNDIESLYDFTDTARVQDYYAVGACPHGEDMIMVLYANEEASMCVVYDITNGKEKERIEMDVALSLKAKPVGVSSDFAYIREDNGVLIYLDWKNNQYEVVQLDDEPESLLMLGEGEAVYYTVSDDCNIYNYIHGSNNCYSIYDGSDVVDSLELRYLISAGTSIILHVESEGYTGYAQLSIEMQELTVFDGLSGELIYNDNEYIYTVPEKQDSILIYNPMTPRVIKEFRVENPEEICNLTLYSEEGLFLTQVEEENEKVIRFYDLNNGILKNQLVIPSEYKVIGVDYFENSLCVLVEGRIENGEYRMLIWNTDIIEEILE